MTTDRGVLVVGEGLIDVVPGPDGGTRELPGGSPLNVAVGLGRLGHDVTLATWLRPDARGRLIADHLARSHVRLLPGSDGAGRTATATARLDPGGDAAYTFDLEWRCPAIPEDVTPGWVHAGSIGAVLAPGGADVLAAVRRLRTGALVSFDPNVRPAIVGEVAAVRPLVEAYVALADVVKVSADDLAWLYPGGVPQAVAAEWADRGPALVVLTRGDRGALAYTRAFALNQPSVPLAVADTIGAGDAFTAGLLHGLIGLGLGAAGRRDALRALTPASAQRVLAVAARVAALTVGRPGADPPWLAELERWPSAGS